IKPSPPNNSFLACSLFTLGFLLLWAGFAFGGRWRCRFWKRLHSNGEHEVSGGYVVAADCYSCIEVFEGLEFHFHRRLFLADLFQQHLSEILRDTTRFASPGHTIEGHGDEASVLFDHAFERGNLNIWRDAMRHLFQQRCPVKAVLNITVEC